MTRGDKVTIVVCVLVTALIWTGFYAMPKKPQVSYAVLRIDGKELARMPLDGKTMSQRVVEIPKGPITIEYGQGKARLLPHNYCPDGVCWRTGWISIPGQSAICIPNHMTLTIEGAKSDVDSIAR